MKIIVDNREQTPLRFTRIEAIPGTLQSGDYSVQNLEHVFAVERKSIDDLIGSCTSDRERFERELHRLRGFHFKRLLIIGTRSMIETHRYRSNAVPKAILATLSAFEVRYDLPVIFAATPEEGAILIESWAYWFTREQIKRSEGLELPVPLAQT